MSRRKRFLIILAVVVVLCGAYVLFFGIVTMFAVEARYMGWKMPVVKQTPRALQNSSISGAAGRKLSYFGYEFEVPWDDVDDARTKVYPNGLVGIVFHSGVTMIFTRSGPKESVTGVQSKLHDTLQACYGEKVLQSDYALTRLILEATPDKITLLTSRKDAVGGLVLLVLKGIATGTEANSGIYSIETRHFQGFQYGGPQSRPRKIIVDLFADDGGRLEFIFGGKDGPANISQSDINRVVQTVHQTGPRDSRAKP